MYLKMSEMERSAMNDTATLSRLFAGIQPDLDQVDVTFEERATSGLDILNSASMHALGAPGKRLRTALTLLSGKMKTYRFDKLLPLSVALKWCTWRRLFMMTL